MEDMRDNEPPKRSITYAQLRKMNRDAYAATTESKYDRVIHGGIGGETRKIVRAEPSAKADATETNSSAKRNKYGDLWPTHWQQFVLHEWGLESGDVQMENNYLSV